MARSSKSAVDAAASDAGGSSKQTPSSEPAAEPSFEEALARLEQVVDRLEQGDVALEASLAAFEEGVRLSGRCAAQLDAAERRIEVLTKQGSSWMARPFEAGGEADAEDGEDG
jgi:exodeoxyribonuclease VII small subunit